jgi:fluoroquinolone transport system permease protein
MNKEAVKRIALTDAKNILRDYSLSIMLVVPFLCLVLVRWGGGLLVQSFPEFSVYIPAVVVLMSAMVAAFPSFMIGFVVMDEKDSAVTEVYKVVPFSLERLLILRCVNMTLLGFVNSILMLSLNGLMAVPVIQMLILALQMALFAPFGMLLMVSLAANKIEAAAILKGVTFILVVGVVQFIIPGDIKYLLSPIPLFWTSRAFSMVENLTPFLLFSTVSVALHISYILTLFRRAVERL